MALTLDPTLATSQDSLNRQPLVKLISTQIADAIPFDGQYFNDLSETEKKSNIISCSTGQLLTAFIREIGIYKNIFFLYTDIERTFWTEVAITSSGFTISNLALVELVGGNIGIIYVLITGTTYYLKQLTIDLLGNIVSSPTVIATYLSPNSIKDPFVIRLADGTYFLVYVHFGGIYYSIQRRTSNDFSSWSSESEIVIDLDYEDE